MTFVVVEEKFVVAWNSNQEPLDSVVVVVVAAEEVEQNYYTSVVVVVVVVVEVSAGSRDYVPDSDDVEYVWLLVGYTSSLDWFPCVC